MSLHRAWMLSVGLLLVVVTLGCGDKPGPEVGRDAAIAEIERLGGTYRCDEGSPDRTIVTVALRGGQVTDAGLEHLKGLTSLQVLALSNTHQVTDAGLEHLKGLTSLLELSLIRAQSL